MIDIGANLASARFNKDREAVIERSKAAGLRHIVLTGSCEESCQQVLEMAKQEPDFLSATTGVHPHHASEWTPELRGLINELARHEKCVAVGECGLDFNRDFSPRDQQEQAFIEHLEIAVELQKPLFLHERDAHERFSAILQEYRDRLGPVVVHCFTGTKQQLVRYLDLDCHIGVTGWVSDKKRGDDLREAVPLIPDNRLMIETDAPYLMPGNIRPRPKSSRNEPAYLPYVAAKVAELRGISPEALQALTEENTRRFFSI